MKLTNEKLMGVSSKNETAERILKMVAERRRNTIYTAFSGLRADLKKRDGKAVDRKEFDETFKELAAIGAGKLDCSKRGVCLGFHWTVPIREIGELLKNEGAAQDVVASIEVKAAETTEKKTHQTATVVIIRRNQSPQVIKTDEKHLKLLQA